MCKVNYQLIEGICKCVTFQIDGKCLSYLEFKVEFFINKGYIEIRFNFDKTLKNINERLDLLFQFILINLKEKDYKRNIEFIDNRIFII